MSVSDWLPAEALVAPPVRETIEAAVAQWSQAWFAGRMKLRLTALEPRAPLWAAELGAAAWQRHGRALSIAVPRLAVARLRSRALDLSPPPPRAETDRDAALLRGFDRRMLEDLAARVEAALAVGAPEDGAAAGASPPGADCLCAMVAEADGAEALRLAIPKAPVIAFRKAAVAAPPRRSPPAPRRKALAAAPIRVEARLGSARLSLEELRSLAPGDVLLLERRLDEPAELFAAGDARAFAAGRLDAAERLTLIIEPRTS